MSDDICVCVTAGPAGHGLAAAAVPLGYIAWLENWVSVETRQE